MSYLHLIKQTINDNYTINISQIYNKYPLFKDLPINLIINNSLSIYHNTLQQESSQINKLSNTQNKILNKLNQTVTKIDKIMNTSALKGKLGESLIENWTNQLFPDYILENTTKQTDNADYILHAKKDILIEVKNYKSSVPTSTINKFKNQLHKSHCKYGVFISFGKITNTARINYINHNNKLLILIPNANPQMYKAIILSILFINDNSDNNQSILNKYKNAINTIKTNIQTIDNNISLINKKVSNIHNSSNQIKSIIQNL